MIGSSVDVLGLFPSYESGQFGGVQISGREAWKSIAAEVGDGRVHALCYQGGMSKTRAILEALGIRRKAKVVFVWHLQLLKLLPFVNHSSSRLILFLHGVEAWREHDPLTRFLLKRVNLILSNSDFTWSRFLRCNPAFEDKPHRTIHLGIGCGLNAPTSLASNVPAALMLSRLDRREDYKGHRQMIEAWPRVLERKPDAQLWIVGDGDLRPSLEDLARQRVPSHSVRFYGQVSDVEKERLIAHCRCLALPSRAEGFGLVYLEAMRMGRPCLVSNVDAGREVVNPPEAGLAVDPDDSAQIAHAVHRLLTSGPEWDQWSQRARARYESRFTGEHFRQRLATALFEI
jgi:phosphatidyl-myo-inositol dimannoside synthase